MHKPHFTPPPGGPACEPMPGQRRIGREIHRLANQIHRYLDACGGASQVEVITSGNAWIIRFLIEKGDREVYQKDLEAELGITRSTASRTLQLMEQKGLLRRQSVEHDARLKRLVLTEKARELDSAIRHNGMAADNRLLSGFSAQEQSALFDFIDRMRKNLETDPSKDGGTVEAPGAAAASSRGTEE